MKKIAFGIALLISTSSFAANPPVDEKVSKIFMESFPHISNAKWYEYESFYEVLFETNKITSRIKYNLNGHVLSVRRDYYEKDLPLFVFVKVKEKYTGKKIFGVTEITSEEGVTYNIILEDDKNWITVKADATGNMHITQKLNKAKG